MVIGFGVVSFSFSGVGGSFFGWRSRRQCPSLNTRFLGTPAVFTSGDTSAASALFFRLTHAFLSTSTSRDVFRCGVGLLAAFAPEAGVFGVGGVASSRLS
jgi:hypothetical protein